MKHNITDYTEIEVQYNLPLTTAENGELEYVQLRDQFAIAALTGLCACAFKPQDVDNKMIAEISYVLADAMLKARKVK